MNVNLNCTTLRRCLVFLFCFIGVPTIFSQTKQFLSSQEVEMIAKSNVENEKSTFDNIFTDFDLTFNTKVKSVFFEKYSQNFSSIKVEANQVSITILKDEAYIVDKLINDLFIEGIELKNKKSKDFRLN